MDKFLQQIVAFLRGLSLRQQVVLAGSAVLVAAIIWGFAAFFSAGDAKPLYSGMAPADAQMLVQRLANQNIAAQLSTDGTTVLVRSDQLDKARFAATAQGPISSGRMGFELFDKPNWSGSDFSEKVNYQRAVETELERTIQTMNGVDSVRVHLVLPRDSLFSERERPAKASVVLKLRGARLTEQLAMPVANLVASSWDGLSPQNVTVVTTDGQIPSPGQGRMITGGAGNADLETLLAERLVQTLSPVVGAGRIKSSITIDYDPTSGESTQELYDPNNSVVLSSQISQETVGDLEPAGIPGTPSNAPNSQANATAAAQTKTNTTTQGIHSESKTFAVSRTTRHLLEPAGRVKRLAAAILVDDAIESKTENGKTQETRRKRTPEELNQIEELAKAAIGFDAQRGDMFSLQNISFVQAPVEVVPPPGKIQKIMVFAERWTGLLRYAALFVIFLLVYALVLRPVQKQVMGILRDPARMIAAGGVAGALPPSVSASAASEAASLPAPGTHEGRTPEVSQTIQLKKELVNRIKLDPEGASRLVQNWVRESETNQGQGQ
jgi:flagellar M-ring protein FliF